MNTTNQPENHTLQLSMATSTDIADLNTAAAVIRTMPYVLRVRVNTKRRELEILCRYSPRYLLQQLHLAIANGQDATRSLAHT